ncbi:MAG: ABC transporter ATP-binding protein [Pseudomonadota bacterium]
MADALLTLAGLSKHFGALTACDSVTLDLRPGEIHALIGPNGAGKSTLMKLIAGELPADAGSVTLDGENISELNAVQRARKGMARTFQISSLAPEFTVLQNVMLSGLRFKTSVFSMLPRIMNRSDLRERAMELLQRVDLTARAETPVAAISHGERRQLEVALALAATPKLLLMDEPMAGMGPDGTRRLTDLIASLKREVPILLVEHDMDAIFALADRLTVLVYGKIIASGSVADVRENPSVQEAYLGAPA